MLVLHFLSNTNRINFIYVFQLVFSGMISIYLTLFSRTILEIDHTASNLPARRNPPSTSG